jgi:uncharacterized protein
MTTGKNVIQSIFTFRWKHGKDVAAVFISWLLVTGTLYIASIIVGSTTGGGLPYFFLYAILCATLFGIGIPLAWTVAVRKRPISDLGFTRKYLGISIGLQLVFAVIQFIPTLAKTALPPLEKLLPLVALAFTIGFFEAVFWRGWTLLRLEEAFGLIPAIVIGSLLYAAYHVGYGMPLEEMAFLFWIGVLYAVAFRLTKNVFILWPIFQPMGQLVTLTRDGLQLPLIASLGFFEVFILMAVLIWLANRYYQKRQHHKPGAKAAPVMG